MTATNDRRHRIQRYTVPQVSAAIDDAVFGEDNRVIMRDLFLGNLTYEQTADKAHLSLRGLYKRVGSVAPAVENYLQKLN